MNMVKSVKNKYGIVVGDVFQYAGDTNVSNYQVVGITEGGVYVKEIHNKFVKHASGHDKILAPSIDDFVNNKAPEYKRVMQYKWSTSKDPFPLYKPYYIVVSSAYDIHAFLLKPKYRLAGTQVTDSQFW